MGVKTPCEGLRPPERGMVTKNEIRGASRDVSRLERLNPTREWTTYHVTGQFFDPSQ